MTRPELKYLFSARAREVGQRMLEEGDGELEGIGGGGEGDGELQAEVERLAQNSRKPMRRSYRLHGTAWPSWRRALR